MRSDQNPAGQVVGVGRTARRRRIGAAAAAVALVVALGVGIHLSRRAPDQVQPRATATTTAAPQVAAVGWNAAVVARDGTTITVYATPGDTPCGELAQPQATITGQTDTEVVVAVSGRVVTAVDCATSGRRVPLVVSLPTPLGERVLRDAASNRPPPTFADRDLPDLASDPRWSPHPSQCDEGLCQGYNGPDGLALSTSASSRTAEGGGGPPAVATVPVGSRRGTITGSADSSWQVRWEVGDLAYSLRLIPGEGAVLSLKEFRAVLASLRWG
ncbi:hypothetical protein ABZS77_04590 [Micromonospora sp. NPDC005298]|uniref:hypothetical protein n=1 Tax=Micromonospora sp. NPDC005298 TaxID=3156873 RepID=UPI0033AA742C